LGSCTKDGWDVDAEVAKAAQKLLGNMVLLRTDTNRDIGNRRFDEKREALAESGYLLTRQVAEYEIWGLEEIQTRQAALAKIAARTWSLDFAQ
jgi:hypothetical protein